MSHVMRLSRADFERIKYACENPRPASTRLKALMRGEYWPSERRTLAALRRITDGR